MTIKSISTSPVDIHLQDEMALMTGDELFIVGEIGSGELIKGVFIQMTPPGYWHGIIENRVGQRLGAYIEQHKLGYVMVGEAGVYTGRNPDTVRGMDIAFISHKRMATVQSNSYLDVAPELIVEILSPSDRWNDVNDKLAEYFAVNVLLVWVVDPKQKQVHVYRSVTDVKILTTDDQLEDDEVLPGFSTPIIELFI